MFLGRFPPGQMAAIYLDIISGCQYISMTIFLLQISQYMRSRDDYDLVVFYEDILSDKEKVCKELLEVCKIPLEYVPEVS